MAHWSTSAEPSRSVVTMLRELDAAGFETVLVSAAEVEGPIGRVCTWAPGEPAIPERTTVLRRANVGYDFGSWGSALAAFPGVAAASRVLLVNDSLIGPFAPLGPILADFEACGAPVWGLSGSLQHRPHVQSFFVGYKGGILGHPRLRAFWADIRVESRKAKIVRYNELGLSEALDGAGISWESMFVPQPGGPPNPTIEAWAGMLVQGFPFVKGEAVLAPTNRVPDLENLQITVRSHMGSDLAAWLPQSAQLAPPPGDRWLANLPEQVRYVVDVNGPLGLWEPVRNRARAAVSGVG